MTGRPYVECPECGSAAVVPPDPARRRPRYACTRCGHKARRFDPVPFDPTRFDNRPRQAGRVLPTCREE